MLLYSLYILVHCSKNKDKKYINLDELKKPLNPSKWWYKTPENDIPDSTTCLSTGSYKKTNSYDNVQIRLKEGCVHNRIRENNSMTQSECSTEHTYSNLLKRPENTSTEYMDMSNSIEPTLKDLSSIQNEIIDCLESCYFECKENKDKRENEFYKTFYTFIEYRFRQYLELRVKFRTNEPILDEATALRNDIQELKKSLAILKRDGVNKHYEKFNLLFATSEYIYEENKAAFSEYMNIYSEVEENIYCTIDELQLTSERNIEKLLKKRQSFIKNCESVPDTTEGDNILNPVKIENNAFSAKYIFWDQACETNTKVNQKMCHDGQENHLEESKQISREEDGINKMLKELLEYIDSNTDISV